MELALNKLCKWRALFAGWQLGTRLEGDPESDAVRDHRELSLLLRVDTNALTSLLISKGVFTKEEVSEAMRQEAIALDQALEKRFPGVTSTNFGLNFDSRAEETMKGWKP